MIILNCLWIISQNNIRFMRWSWWRHYVAYWYKIYDNIVWWLYMMMICHKDTVMLRSTMGSYERLVIEAAYGETMIRSVEIIWEILAWEEWLECSHDSLSMFDIPGLTLVCTSYVIFFGFHDIKIYILYFKIYIFIKRTLVVSDFILTRWCSEKVFDRP